MTALRRQCIPPASGGVRRSDRVKQAARSSSALSACGKRPCGREARGMTPGRNQASPCHLPRATRGWREEPLQLLRVQGPTPEQTHQGAPGAGKMQATKNLLRGIQEKEGEGERSWGEQAALRGNCQALTTSSPPVAMTTPSCVPSRNKLLITDTAFLPSRNPQCPLPRHHLSPPPPVLYLPGS